MSWSLCKMRQFEWGLLAPQVHQLVRDAGAAIMRVYQRSGQGDARVAQKSDDSPLTLADLASHHAICNGLLRLTPDVPVVSEEDAESLVHRVPHGSFWLIDPLDGTKEFLARNGEFTVNIALITDGEPVWGVVYAPALDQMYWGGGTFGAFRQDGDGSTPIRVPAPVTPAGRYRAVASKSHLNAETTAFLERLGAADLIQVGSSLKFCRIAEGNADVYPRLAPTYEWDTAAAQAVVEGAGGHVYDVHGARLRYGKPEVLNPGFIAASVPLTGLRSIND